MAHTIRVRIIALQDARDIERREIFAHARQNRRELPVRSSEEAIRKLRRLKIYVDNWYVKVGFRHENPKRLSSDWHKVEERLKEGDVARKLVNFSTHIILAVRAFKHLREGYQEEMKQTDGLLRILDQMNLTLASKKGVYTMADITAVEGMLAYIAGNELAKKKVAVKRIVARAKLNETVAKLKEALEKEPEERGALVRAACAQFTAARNRLGKWRDRQIAGILVYNEGREKLLKIVRDIWVKEQLKRFAKDPEIVHRQIELDKNRLFVLDNLRTALRDGDYTVNYLLYYIKENSKLFRVPQRKREGAEEAIALSEKGVRVIGKDILIGHYAYLYRYIKAGNKEKAKRKLDQLELFINANKPRFILEQLQASEETDLEPVLIRLEKAVAALEQKYFGTAKNEFEKTHRIMQSTNN
ncbi:MAG: hypothetical protein Q7S22_03395 [Candidatus Micrarchaeota archaeon]|nr:hypothetical protein [Candidatus Micrarchaeota archaeon]